MIEIYDGVSITEEQYTKLMNIPGPVSYITQAMEYIFSIGELQRCGFRIINTCTQIWDPVKLDVLYCKFPKFTCSELEIMHG